MSCSFSNAPWDSGVSEMTGACGTVLSLNVRQNVLHINDQRLSLKPTSCKLLAVLLRHGGQIVSRKTILIDVWGYDFDPGTKIIDVQVCHLRKALNSLQAPFGIKAHRGIGICLHSVLA